MKTVIVKTGSTWQELSRTHGDFEDWIIQAARLEPSQVQIMDVQQRQRKKLPNQIQCLIITGSHENVSDTPPWQEYAIELIQQAMSKSIPILGICYGHQLLASMLGGKVSNHPDGGEFGITHIRMLKEASEDPLCKFMPDGFIGFVNHGQTVSVLPDGAVSLASSTAEAHQIVRYNEHTWGVQYHPEFNREISRLYLQKSYKIRKKGIFMNPDSVNFDSRVSRVFLPLFIRENRN